MPLTGGRGLSRQKVLENLGPTCEEGRRCGDKEDQEEGELKEERGGSPE